MKTLLINEQFVSQFKYWREGHVWTGMRFRSDLFEYISKFTHQQRHQAFDLAWKLAQSGKEAIITATPNHYTVWVNLREASGADMADWLHPAMQIEALNHSVNHSVDERSLEAALSA
jgi:hypothetical protein